MIQRKDTEKIKALLLSANPPDKLRRMIETMTGYAWATDRQSIIIHFTAEIPTSIYKQWFKARIGITYNKDLLFR